MTNFGTYTESWVTEKETKMCFVISPIKLGQFWWNLVHSFLNKFAAKWCKRFPPQLSNVSTIPCETLNHHHHHHPRISSPRKSWNKTSGLLCVTYYTTAVMSMLLWPIVCIAVWSAEQFRFQCTLECPSDGSDVIAGRSVCQTGKVRLPMAMLLFIK